MNTLNSILAIIPSVPGWGELLIIAFVGLLLFGRRLPEVGRSLGKGIVEFKKGLRGIEDDIEEASSRPSSTDRVLPPSDTPSPSSVSPRSEAAKTEVHSD